MRMESGQLRTDAPAQSPMSLVGRAAEHVRQFLCGLHGHDALLHFGKGRLSLQCTSCGYETPGWDVKATPARKIADGKGHVVQMPLVRHRRVA